MTTSNNLNKNSKTVLIIEDSPTQALHTNALLERRGIRAVCATTGLMGLNLSRQIHPDLIVLDIQLPDVNGYEVCKKLKEDATTQNIPVIMLTRNDALDSLQKGIECGADDYIPKDAFADAVLIETLRQMKLLPE